MAMTVQHVHLNPGCAKNHPVLHGKLWRDHEGRDPGPRLQLDLHGVQLNVTGLIPEQNHAQSYGIEHLAVVTDTYSETISRLRGNGVAILEELTGSSGKRVAFVQAEDGAQMEIIEKA